MTESFNLFDMVFMTAALVFVMIAFFKGFVKEIFSLFGWLIALSVSYFGTPFVSHLLSSYSGNKMALDIASRTILFIVVFFLFSLLTSGTCRLFQSKIPNSIDKSLGILYGIGKTVLIFSVIYSLTANFYSSLMGDKSEDSDKFEEVPSWLSEAESSNLLKSTAVFIDPAVKSFMGAITENMSPEKIMEKTLDDKIKGILERGGDIDNDLYDKLDSEKAIRPDDLPDEIEDIGYNKKDIEKMTRLLDIIAR